MENLNEEEQSISQKLNLVLKYYENDVSNYINWKYSETLQDFEKQYMHDIISENQFFELTQINLKPEIIKQKVNLKRDIKNILTFVKKDIYPEYLLDENKLKIDIINLLLQKKSVQEIKLLISEETKFSDYDLEIIRVNADIKLSIDELLMLFPNCIKILRMLFVLKKEGIFYSRKKNGIYTTEKWKSN